MALQNEVKVRLESITDLYWEMSQEELGFSFRAPNLEVRIFRYGDGWMVTASDHAEEITEIDKDIPKEEVPQVVEEQLEELGY